MLITIDKYIPLAVTLNHLLILLPIYIFNWLNVDYLFGIYVIKSQWVSLDKLMMSYEFDVIYHPFPINSQYLKTWGW